MKSTLQRSHWRIATLVVAELFMAGAAQGQLFGPLNKDFEEKPWEEQKQQLPAFPKEEHLKQIDVGPITSFRFFVDTESINVGTDGVVRFSLIARSDAGAVNVTFEGLRCNTQERKIYALGRTDLTWIEARNSSWSGLARQFVNPAQTVLYEDYFCPGRVIVPNLSEAVDAVKYGGHPRGRSKAK